MAPESRERKPGPDPTRGSLRLDVHRKPPAVRGETIARQLADRIVEGSLKAGDRLPSERTLALQFGVSRTVIRDAIAALVERGMVDVQPGRGAFVHLGSERAIINLLDLLVRRNHLSLRDLIESRYILEEHVASLAAERAGEDDLAALDRALEAMVEHRHRPFAFVEADVVFHECLARAADNPLLLSFLACIRGVLSESMLLGTSVQGAMETSIKEHRLVLEAVRARDAEAARRSMHAHLQGYQLLMETGQLRGAVAADRDA